MKQWTDSLLQSEHSIRHYTNSFLITTEEREKLSESLGISIDEFNTRADSLHENNPMLGHRGVRLGITYPEITEVQIRAIFEATAELLKEGKKPFPEIMIPVTCTSRELKHQYVIIDKVYKEVCEKFGLKKIGHLSRNDD